MANECCSICKGYHDGDECRNTYLKDFEQAVEVCKPIFKEANRMRNLEQLLKVKEQNERLGLYKPFPHEEAEILHKHYMQLCKLPLSKCTMPIYNAQGTKIANSYERIVVGDYGAYIEIKPEDMVRSNIQVRPSEAYRMTEKYAKSVKYFWLESKDNFKTKIYYQQRTVSYADYKVGMCYVSPFDVTLESVE